MIRISPLFMCILLLLSNTAQSTVLKPPVFIHIKTGFGETAHSLKYKGNGIYQTTLHLAKGNWEFVVGTRDKSCQYRLIDADKLKFNTAHALAICQQGNIAMRTFKAADYELTFDNGVPESPTISIRLKPSKKQKRMPPPVACIQWDGKPVDVYVSEVFDEGDIVRDFYSGQTAVVKNGMVSMQPSPESQGLLLLEKADHQASPFTWDNVSVYFIMTDRFHNGNPDNDDSYGRKQDEKDNIGTFHGGDFAGITQKLDYLLDLGINAIWISPIVEQIHGFVGGSPSGKFPFYAYHGYWALDFTTLDKNWGTEEELETLIDEAHNRGIRVILDVVINHVGYNNLADMQRFQYGEVDIEQLPKQWRDWQAAEDGNWHDYNQYIDYKHPNAWQNWWGADWVRSGLPGYQEPTSDDLTMALAGLPDFLTESQKAVELPPLLKNKPDTRAKHLPNASVSDYLIKWQSDWVRRFGFDGFRGDTAKHVEYELWQGLKIAGQKALAEWRNQHPEKVRWHDDFWMVGEVWDHPVYKDQYYDYGFDSLVNFEFQKHDAMRTAQCLAQANDLYESYANKINTDPSFNALHYISSHDTKLFFGDFQDHDLQKGIAAPLLFMPGGVQIYYGDEIGRDVGPFADDPHQGTRSDMPWDAIKGEKLAVLKHWQKISQFRQRHRAIGAGNHTRLSTQPYSFSRIKGEDKVIIVYAGQKQQ